jgi:hypothetical protein
MVADTKRAVIRGDTEVGIIEMPDGRQRAYLIIYGPPSSPVKGVRKKYNNPQEPAECICTHLVLLVRSLDLYRDKITKEIEKMI